MCLCLPRSRGFCSEQAPSLLPRSLPSSRTHEHDPGPPARSITTGQWPVPGSRSSPLPGTRPRLLTGVLVIYCCARNECDTGEAWSLEWGGGGGPGGCRELSAGLPSWAGGRVCLRPGAHTQIAALVGPSPAGRRRESASHFRVYPAVTVCPSSCWQPICPAS